MSILKINIAQHSTAGVKETNQDYAAAQSPKGYELSSKGVALALADGISTSQVSQYASETVVTSFLSDYYCTPDAWSVKQSVLRVVNSANAWLYAQSQNSPYRYDKEKGYICTFAAVVFKAHQAHIFHCGDSRVYRVSGNELEPLTQDHQGSIDSHTQFLTRAIGIHHRADLDYRCEHIHEGDVYVLATDGFYRFISEQHVAQSVQNELFKDHPDFEALTQTLIKQALEVGSDDNLSLQIAYVDALPEQTSFEWQERIDHMKKVPRLTAGVELDGYRIIRDIYLSARSHVHLAEDLESGVRVIIKTPSNELADNQDFLESLLMEEWVAKRLNNIHVLKPFRNAHPQTAPYSVFEFIEGQTLKQWQEDNPTPSLEKVRDFASQIAKGLQAFHRQEMVHQDLRPNNVMMDAEGTLKLIDFGATYVAGVAERSSEGLRILGTAQFTAPEYYLGQQGTAQADIFSFGVMVYHLLSGELPYGNAISRARTEKDLTRLRYRSLNESQVRVPDWVDYAIGKAVSLQPENRYQEVAEFVYELNHPSHIYSSKPKPSLIERDPLKFWQSISALLTGAVIYLLAK